jgi:hypothetical protein
MLLQAHALSMLKSLNHQIQFLTASQSYQLITPHAKTERSITSEAELFPIFPKNPEFLVRRAYLPAVRGKKRDTAIEIPRMIAMIRSDTRIGIS